MSTRKKPKKNIIQRLFKRSWQLLDRITKAIVNGVLRSLMVSKRRPRRSQAGFVLPTVVMVLLVVALLTTAIVIRSFDRAKNASNYRVNEAVLKAATPAIDRAKAKIEYLFTKDTNLQGDTPPDPNIASVLDDDTYTLGDETPLRLAYNLTANGVTPEGGEPDQQLLDTAWKFPVDTDNNGRFDSFTLYGVYFKNPPVDGSGDQLRARTPLESRALPQEDGQTGGRCPSAAGGAAGWTKMSNGKLKKAFFTYVATVPIAQTQYAALQTTGYKDIPAAQAATQFEAYTGNRGFSALELQLDQARIALDNNAVWFEDDLIINATPTLRLNGRVSTNSNLMASNPDGEFINFLQVSSPGSCFYEPENAKIIVGGNIAAGGPGAQNSSGSAPNTDFTNNQVTVDLYDEGDPLNPPAGWDIPAGRRLTLDSDQNTVTGRTPLQVLSNNTAYAKRLNVLVQGARKLFYQGRAASYIPTVADVKGFARFPQEIGDSFEAKYSDASSAPKLLEKVIETYFKERLRRVSYAEVPANSVPNLAVFSPPVAPTALTGTVLVSDVIPVGAGEQFVFSGGGVITPPLQWMQIDEANTQLPINTAQLPTTGDPVASNEKTEDLIGDRILVGNRLPYRWVKNTSPLEYAEEQEGQAITGVTTRLRYGLAKPLDDIGDTSRNGYWEQAAAKLPGSRFKDDAQGINEKLAGGLRVITGAGIYVDGETTVAQAGTGRRLRRASETVGGVVQPAEINPDGRYPTFANPALRPQLYQEVKSFLPEPPKPEELEARGVNIPQLANIPNLSQNVPGVTPASSPNDYFLVVWPDTMPMYRFNPRDPWDFNNDGVPNVGEGLKGDLQMRATVVYHYNNSNDPDLPIACISSYYDPTNEDTAANDALWTNNGKNYPVQTTRTATPRLRRQARMIFPDGRWVNKPLKDAIEKLDRGEALNLADKAAIDAANCALTILNNPAAVASSPVPNGAIKEAAFLDARQVKTLHKPATEDKAGNPILDSSGNPLADDTLLQDLTDPIKMQIGQAQYTRNAVTQAWEEIVSLDDKYTLPIEQRQPLEIRVTEIDLDVLRQQTYGPANDTSSTEANDEEYLLPNSGIIYASRDDALLDISDPNDDQGGGTSATDFKLDSTRRPNGIRLINGRNLSRKNFYRTAEKGLILVSDVPVYIKGDFNLHLSGSTRVEEFTNLLNMPSAGIAPGNFYARQADDRDDRFACRTGAPGNQCQGSGDQWRAARILADAVTLLSDDFRDGYRNEGDYNLNNNAGNIAVKARLKNGFWWNDFATTANWFDSADGFPRTDFPQDALGNQRGSTYVTNNVTPIQRRVQFPEYVMEACLNQPVSDCGPQDWVYTYARDTELNGVITRQPATQLIGQPPDAPATLDKAGTTALAPTLASGSATPPTGIFESAVRRVAFERNAFGALIPNDPATNTPTCTAATAATRETCTATPLGVNASNQIAKFPYGAGNPTPRLATNALWYATTPNPANPSPEATPGAGDFTPSYENNNLLFYLPFDREEVSERQLLLPGTPEFPQGLNLASLNGGEDTDPSDYAICTQTQFSKEYLPTQAGADGNGACPDATRQAIAITAQQFLPEANTSIPSDDPLPGTPLYGVVSIKPFPAPTEPLRATAKLNIYTLTTPAQANVPGGTYVLDRGNQSDPIFVFRIGSTRVESLNAALAFGTAGSVGFDLKGVDPNNIFWLVGNNVTVDASQANVVGNFLKLGGDSPPGVPPVNFAFTGTPGTSPALVGRVLGFNSVTGLGSNTMAAMTTTDQPLLLPITQLHSYDGVPAAGSAAFPSVGNTPNANQLRWFPIAEDKTGSTPDTTVNAVLVMGDSPSRPLPDIDPNAAEFGGGLQNFPRFLEIWRERINDIKGGLIQLKKSTFATAPFETIDNPGRDTSLFFDGAGGPLYTALEGPNRTDYRYKYGAVIDKAPYYQAPNRQWGYDVGLLSQTPDLFSSQFTQPSAGEPNEFYREVGRDDTWVKTLLCAAEQVTGSTTYQYALPPQERPTSCEDISNYQPST